MGPSSKLTQVRLGPTNLLVTRYCQGTAFLHLERNARDPQAERVLRHCLDASSKRYGRRMEQEQRPVGDGTG